MAATGDRAILTNACLADGRLVQIELVDGSITAIVDESKTAANSAPDEAVVVDCEQNLVVPAFVEPHAHLDKALTADRIANPGGDLDGAISAWVDYRDSVSAEDFRLRAREALAIYERNGCCAVRSHVDVGPGIGLAAVEALVEVRAEASIDVQLVGLVNGITSRDAAQTVALLADAVDMGLDVVGGVPHLESDPAAAIEKLLTFAGERNLPVDLHVDENLDAHSNDLETLAGRVTATGFDQPVTASHCVALSTKPADDQRRISELTAAAGIAVVALPQTNLYLQARGQTVSPPRAIGPVKVLQSAGVTVAAGGDNMRDPFCLVGRGDPLETASLLVMAAHLSPTEAMTAVSAGARMAVASTVDRRGLLSSSLIPQIGDSWPLLKISASTVGEAVATSPGRRLMRI